MQLRSWFARSTGSSGPLAGGRRCRTRPAFDTLEDRLQPAAVAPIDGTGNNVAHPTWGAAGTDLLRTAPVAYGDGISTPAGADRPNARTISNALLDHQDGDKLNDRGLSGFAVVWGQFIDHDIDLTSSATPTEAFNIHVPAGDPEFDPAGTGTQVIGLSRSKWDPTTGTGAGKPRQQVNDITSYIDASMVYGSDATRAAALRTFSSGLLKTSDGNQLPFNTVGLSNAIPGSSFHLAGDIRADENPELTALQTLFVREHNRLAGQFATQHPDWTDEQLYQAARGIVIGEVQSITYNEYLPALLGPAGPRPYAGYNPNVNVSIANEFSTAAFRYGHTSVYDAIEFVGNDGTELRDEMDLKDAFFNPTIVQQYGIDSLLKGEASNNAEEIDLQVIDDLRNFLFGPPGAGGMDLASLNIQRGRDHGLADYNTARQSYGLPAVRSFADISSDLTIQQKLKDVYGSVNKIDLWVGGLAEDHLPGASLGPTFARIITDQFSRLRDGDRFWYQQVFSGPQRDMLEHTTLADVIRHNTVINNLQDNVFFFKTAITGRVFADLNLNGKTDPGEQGLGGRKVQLVGADGAVLATATTDLNGVYRFTGLELGSYKVQELLPPGTASTTPAQNVALTRGMTINVDLGEAPPKKTPPPPTNSPKPPPPPPSSAPMSPLSPDAVSVLGGDSGTTTGGVSKSGPRRS